MDWIVNIIFFWKKMSHGLVIVDVGCFVLVFW